MSEKKRIFLTYDKSSKINNASEINPIIKAPTFEFWIA